MTTTCPPPWCCLHSTLDSEISACQGAQPIGPTHFKSAPFNSWRLPVSCELPRAPARCWGSVLRETPPTQPDQFQTFQGRSPLPMAAWPGPPLQSTPSGPSPPPPDLGRAGEIQNGRKHQTRSHWTQKRVHPLLPPLQLLQQPELSPIRVGPWECAWRSNMSKVG